MFRRHSYGLVLLDNRQASQASSPIAEGAQEEVRGRSLDIARRNLFSRPLVYAVGTLYESRRSQAEFRLIDSQAPLGHGILDLEPREHLVLVSHQSA